MRSDFSVISEDPVGTRRPEVDPDCLPRPRLTSRLEECNSLSATLVCAPAGFGKTTLVCQWAEVQESPVVWLRLDADDGEVERFVRHLIAAIRTAVPDTGETTLALLGQSSLEPSALRASLLTELDAMESPLSIVFDDYSSIPGTAVHDLVDYLLKHLPRNLRLLILARHDPPLAMERHLPAGRLCEFRQADLAFSPEETAAFLEQRTGAALPADLLERIENRLGGWPTGLNLLALSLGDPAEYEQLLECLPDGVRRAQMYLSSELFQQRSEVCRDRLLRLSLLDRFTAKLRGALADEDCAGSTGPQCFERDWVFSIPVEGQASWFTLHPLFREFLEDRCREQLSGDSIKDVHDRAAAWLSEHEHVGEAVDHALLGHDPNSAARILGEHRIRLLNESRYGELFEIAGRLPAEVMDSSLEMALLRVWIAPGGKFAEASARVESMVATEGPLTGKADAARGELRLIQAGRLFAQVMEDLVGLPDLVSCAEDALTLLPAGFGMGRAMASHLLAQTLQCSGDLAGATVTLDAGVEEHALAAGHPLSVILLARCLVHNAEADLVGVRDAARLCLSCLPASNTEFEVIRQARRLLGKVHYQWNELTEAEEIVGVREDRNDPVSQLLLARILQAQGRTSEANALVSEAIDRGTDPGDPVAIFWARANEALIALSQDHCEPALRWAESTDTESIRPLVSGISTSLIRARILVLAGDSGRHRETASELLEKLLRTADTLHMRTVKLEALALSALLSADRGDEKMALVHLRRSLELAARGGFIRLYLDLGPGMKDLLDRVGVDRNRAEFVARLRREFSAEPTRASAQAAQTLPDPLSPRELEVLALLAERLSNKEIARRLYVSLATVKTHASTIYQKLHVHRRRDAVERAVDLGILVEV